MPLSIRGLAGLRERYPALATGPSFVRYAREGLLSVSRFDPSERREYLTVFNASEEEKTIAFGTATPSSGWTQLLGQIFKPVASDGSGRVSLVVGALDAVVFRADSELPVRGAARATLRLAPDRFTNLKVLTASVAGRDPVSVTFSAWSARANAWTRLGSDDGAPYRVFLDPRRYRKGETVSLVAAVRASDGSVSTSPVLSVRPR
jgi:hypothetical protein